jgi:hypothetical protein
MKNPVQVTLTGVSVNGILEMVQKEVSEDHDLNFGLSNGDGHGRVMNVL